VSAKCPRLTQLGSSAMPYCDCVRRAAYHRLMSSAGSDADALRALSTLIDVCGSLPGIYEISHGTAAFDHQQIACGVTVVGGGFERRITARAATTAEAVTSVLQQLQEALDSQRCDGLR
jgi:hypothetical protein